MKNLPSRADIAWPAQTRMARANIASTRQRLLGSGFEIPHLGVECTLEGRPARTPLDVIRETLVARDDIGVFEDSQHRRHHQIAGREAVPIEIGFVSK